MWNVRWLSALSDRKETEMADEVSRAARETADEAAAGRLRGPWPR